MDMIISRSKSCARENVDQFNVKSKILQSGFFHSFARAKLLVASFEEGKIIGACGIRGSINILSLMVDKEYRNMGLGQMLLNRIIEEAKDENYDYIILTVMKGNTNAAHIYRKCGFEALLEFSHKGAELILQVKYLNRKSHATFTLIKYLKTNNRTFNNLLGNIILKIIHHF